MLPVDDSGQPLMNAVLYGVDTRASREIELLNAEFGEERILEVSGNALSSQSVGPKILWLRRQRPEIFAGTARILTSTSYIVFRMTGNLVIDHYTVAVDPTVRCRWLIGGTRRDDGDGPKCCEE